MKKKIIIIIIALVLVFLSNIVSNLKEAAAERQAEAAVTVTVDMPA